MLFQADTEVAGITMRRKEDEVEMSIELTLGKAKSPRQVVACAMSCCAYCTHLRVVFVQRLAWPMMPILRMPK